MLGTVPATLRSWERSGELLPARRTRKGTRYYAVSDLIDMKNDAAVTVGYARVSSHDQKDDLDRQQAALEAYCEAQGWPTRVVCDLGSGLNYRKKGLQTVLEMILRRQMRRLVLTHKDSLMRFGEELIFDLCELQGIEVVIANVGDQPYFEEELAEDVLEIITVFSARLYDARSHKSKKLLDALASEDVINAAKQTSFDAA